jgi:hypothetical protein
LRNFRNEPCLVAAQDFSFSFNGNVAFSVDEGAAFDDYVDAGQPSQDIPGDTFTSSADGTQEQIVTMDFCLDTLEGYFTEGGSESRVNVSLADFFASAHFPCSKTDCGMIDVEAAFADQFNTMFTVPLGFVPAKEFRDAREYKDGPAPDADPFLGATGAVQNNAQRMAGNTANPLTPNVLVREHGKIVPGNTPVYGTITDIADRLGLCGSSATQLVCGQFPARYPGFDGKLGDKHCDVGGSCARDETGDWDETSWTCTGNDCDVEFCSGPPIGGGSGWTDDDSAGPANFTTCFPDLVGFGTPANLPNPPFPNGTPWCCPARRRIEPNFPGPGLDKLDTVWDHPVSPKMSTGELDFTETPSGLLATDTVPRSDVETGKANGQDSATSGSTALTVEEHRTAYAESAGRTTYAQSSGILAELRVPDRVAASSAPGLSTWTYDAAFIAASPELTAKKNHNEADSGESYGGGDTFDNCDHYCSQMKSAGDTYPGPSAHFDGVDASGQKLCFGTFAFLLRGMTLDQYKSEFPGTFKTWTKLSAEGVHQDPSANPTAPAEAKPDGSVELTLAGKMGTTNPNSRTSSPFYVAGSTDNRCVGVRARAELAIPQRPPVPAC